jgi:cytochrome c7-like protein
VSKPRRESFGDDPSASKRVWRGARILLSVLVLAIAGWLSGGRPVKTSAGPMLQAADLDYSTFRHTSQRHVSLACTACHIRTSDNSATPQLPGHKACIGCHAAQYLTAGTSLCGICHSDLKGSDPPRRTFPSGFKESFNVKFDHVQHNTGSGRPASGCAACHSKAGARVAAFSIPSSIAAHNQCYSCHTPTSKSSTGREMASCGVCHDVRSYSRTTTNARAFRYAFSHAKHGNAQRLACADCHRLSAGLPQSRQVSSPAASEHFPATRGMTCLTCHNGNRSFGGDLAFKDCRRCHTAASFRMPL